MGMTVFIQFTRRILTWLGHVICLGDIILIYYGPQSIFNYSNTKENPDRLTAKGNMAAPGADGDELHKFLDFPNLTYFYQSNFNMTPVCLE